MKPNHILILGAGVSGLSTGILLLQAGYEVTIWAQELPPNTTSNKAGAFWYPFHRNRNDKFTEWAKATIRYLRESGMLDDHMSGCVTKTTTELLDHPKGKPWWSDAVGTYRRPRAQEIPPGYVDGYQIEAPLMDTALYMGYILEKFQQLGGDLVKKRSKTWARPSKTTR